MSISLALTINDQQYTVHHELAQSIAIPMVFDGEQPNHFGAPYASARPLEAGGFIGDTRHGGSCNVDVIQMVPHCNGTHTETVGHIVNDDVFINRALEEVLVAATLISVTPKRADNVSDNYQPVLEATDKVIDKVSLRQILETVDDDHLQALVIRSLPNEPSKLNRTYGSDGEQFEPPFITLDAMQYIVDRGVKHLLVDFPSVDKMYDEGLLSSHHVFWNVPRLSRELHSLQRTDCTITELIYVPNYLEDGLYLLNLQSPALQIDAAPSRPLLIPLSAVSKASDHK